MLTPDSRGSSLSCKRLLTLRSRRAIAQCHRASCGSHQSHGTFAALMSAGSLETESFRKKFGDVRLLRSGSALKKDSRVGAELIYHLSARTARRTRYPMIVSDGYSLNFNLGARLGDRGEDCGSFRAIRHSIRGVLHVAARKDFAICQQDRRAHVKLRIGSMRILHHFDGRLLQLFTYARRDLLGHRKFIDCELRVKFGAIPESCVIVNPH